MDKYSPIFIVREAMQIAGNSLFREISKIIPEVIKDLGFSEEEAQVDETKKNAVMKEAHERFLKTTVHADNEIIWERALKRLSLMMTENEAVAFYAVASTYAMSPEATETLNAMESFNEMIQDHTDDQSSSSESGKS